MLLKQLILPGFQITGPTENFHGRLVKSRNCLAIPLVLLVLQACVSTPADFKQPQVSLRSVSLRAANVLTPDFNIVLNVGNPNRKALAIRGMTYRIHLSGHKVIEGVANDIPTIAAFAEAEVNLVGKADLLAGLGVLNELLARPSGPLEYQFEAELDLGTLYPTVRVQRDGVIALGSGT